MLKTSNVPTESQMREVVEQVARGRASGMKQDEAAAKAGVHPTTYYSYLKRLGIKPTGKKKITSALDTGVKVTTLPVKRKAVRQGPRPTMIDILPAPTVSAGKVFMFYGNAEEVSAVMRSLQ